MKDIIDKLIEQAYVEVPHERDEGFTRQLDKRLLVKLVVDRCAEIPSWCIETGEDQFVETVMAHRTSEAIKKHFGVEK